MKDFSSLEKKIEVDFKDKDLLAQAFCHRSYLNEDKSFELGNNERLEFLGDAVLELVVTEFLYHNYPGEPEGRLTSWRSALVNDKMLGGVAMDMGFNDYLLLSRGEQEGDERARISILADSFEAFLGALFLDSGYEDCQDFVESNLLARLEKVIEEGLYIDSKSRFQEEAQDRVGVTPEYRVLNDWGPDHDKNFLVGVYLEEELIAKGEGSSKQAAEEGAAQKGLIEKNW